MCIFFRIIYLNYVFPFFLFIYLFVYLIKWKDSAVHVWLAGHLKGRNVSASVRTELDQLSVPVFVTWGRCGASEK